MVINKYTGKTEEEAMSKVREELGNAAVIMNVKVIKPKGLRSFFKSSTYEVTAAVEDDGFSKEALDFANVASETEENNSEEKIGTFDAVADDALILKDAFSAVNEVLEKQEGDTMTSNQVEFEPLSGSAPRAKLIEPTYSKPAFVKAPVKPEPEEETTVGRTPVEMPIAASHSEKLSIDNDNHVFVKMLYNVLLDNEVQEKYINQVLDDMDKVLQTSHSLDNLLSSVYQKMVLKLGTPTRIVAGEKKPKVIFFIGPTGVGKTTTIAKIASKFKVEEGKKVGLITADTFRMAAANQLQTYANILGVPLNVIYSSDELLDTVKKQNRECQDLDVILVDTIGFSHKNQDQKNDTKKLVNALGEFYDSEVYLVLSATTKHKDLIDIADTYMEFTKFNLIFTKLDETKCLGNIFNLKLYTGAPLSYITTGQNVPDDIEIVNAQKLVKQLLGGN
ncbi:flagellar biosynthesis protein FlhF [Pseudobutyrivibrio xylanivorans]|uniref:Flagellar biosynthesis protein FlhF n=1 Tax=Pseudobutyrivibrio xylanivorans DSM 14809 TaxID=1123012 RepID=A0A1M6EIB4_PSEXY|nr:flagellar biosynthesis protein FlhF [Pseudobutyrivibrio xylanivorans]SHI85234.1 flagellar biosynthesis protein FlhF [Pseudobutyrivibrio xylanivorans DSM 14809]